MHGSFCWYELMTTDTAAAETFYKSVIGWDTRDAGHPTMPYTIFASGADAVAGMMTLPQDAIDQGARPGWIGYVEVDDVDASAAKVKELGGKLHVPPTDIPTVGRFSMAADPHGAVITLFKPSPQMHASPTAANHPGYSGWRELYAGDGPAAFDFYSALFGWTRGEAIDMGPMGVYQLFEVGGEMTGAVMTRPPNIPAAFWNYYFQVDSVKAAIDRVTAAGGQVIHGPMEVPGGAWVIQALDPQGAMVSLLSAGA